MANEKNLTLDGGHLKSSKITLDTIIKTQILTSQTQQPAINQNTANPFVIKPKNLTNMTNPFLNNNNTNNSSNSSNIGNIGNNNLFMNTLNNNPSANSNPSVETNMIYLNSAYNTQITQNIFQNINSNQGANTNTNTFRNPFYNMPQQDYNTQSFSSTVQGQGATNGYVNKLIDDTNPFKKSTATNASSSNLIQNESSSMFSTQFNNKNKKKGAYGGDIFGNVTVKENSNIYAK